MGVPDKTYFGEGLDGQPIFYGDVRAITDDQVKLQLLKNRVDVFLIKQVEELNKKDEKNELKVWSPFPLAVMTLLAIETVGHIIGDMDKIKNENEYNQSKAIVTPVYQLIDVELSHKPTKDFYEGFEKIHGTSDKKSIKKYSDVIHKYQRNTFNHGYQAKGVYLNHRQKAPWIINEKEGFLIINPYLFWDKFRITYEFIFQNVLNSKEKEWQKNALNYFNRLLI
ncbi:MAG: hypothetical protein KF852_03575 [Saprospiraceae bacterium]|nr:hypothetical protein [Saprospiraceae bacterium]